MKNTEMPVVLITGCSSGIGLGLARQLYDRKDLRVIVTARKTSLHILHSEFLSGGRFLLRELDVTNDENIYHLVNEIAGLWGRVDCVINNAAICYRAVVEHMDEDAELLQLKTNYLGPMSLIRAVLPIMREQRSGQIINVSSVAGMLAMPTMGSYSASKHALEGATESLWYEARPFGIHVTLAELGFVNSESFKRVILTRKAEISSDVGGPHSEYYRSMGPFIAKLMRVFGVTPKTIAKRMEDLIGAAHPPLRKALTFDVFLFSLLRRLLPSHMQNRILYRLLPGSVRWGRTPANRPRVPALPWCHL